MSEHRTASELLAHYQAGADFSAPAEGPISSTGQLWGKLLSSPVERREKLLSFMLAARDDAAACFQCDHAGLLRQVVQLGAELMRERMVSAELGRQMVAAEFAAAELRERRPAVGSKLDPDNTFGGMRVEHDGDRRP